MKHLFSVLAGCAFLGTLVAADDPMAEIMAVTQKNSVTVKEKQTDKKGSDKNSGETPFCLYVQNTVRGTSDHLQSLVEQTA